MVDVKQLEDCPLLTEIDGRRPAGKEVGTILAWSVVAMATNGHAMITMGIGLFAGVFYWLASYKLAFWILVYAIIYGGLGILRGDNHARPIFRGDSEFTVVVLMPVAWHIGRLAGYL
ncbi:MAG TPA: hypothetical protein VGH47_01800 [Xanthobacteraceae bacterium]